MPYCFWLIVLADFYIVWHKYHSLNFFSLQINVHRNEVAIVFSFHKALAFTTVCIVWFHHMVIYTYCYMNITQPRSIAVLAVLCIQLTLVFHRQFRSYKPGTSKNLCSALTRHWKFLSNLVLLTWEHGQVFPSLTT